MSFSSDVKEEMSRIIPSARHCQLAEIAAMVEFGGMIGQDMDGNRILGLAVDNDAVCTKYLTMLKKTFGIGSSGRSDDEAYISMLQALKIIDNSGVMHNINDPVSPMLLKQSCCKRAYIRGAFLCIGSMSDPKRSYHLEFVCDTRDQADQLVDQLKDLELDARITERKKRYVVYMKEGSAIVDLLGLCEAHVSLMQMENDRIVREVRGDVNRRVNCEAANISKTVNAATRQIEDIEYLRDNGILDGLPGNLKEMAIIRLDNPDATLPELGKLFDPPLGKSGVNHRLRKLSEIAEDHRISG
ncbi:MAG: DNA-binding protein WhiA [Lachnospiraceae bacterium]|nr:DNA-binding protein WhiA [Lachnospiraceae bacterium]